MFNTKQISWVHPQVYSEEQMGQFDVDFQKQLTFNFCATHATRMKAATINEAWASHLRNVDLDVMPVLFSLKTTDRHNLSCFVLEDVLGCSVGCRLLNCIRANANADANPTEVSYSNQAKFIAGTRKDLNIRTECWRMAVNNIFFMQGQIVRATLHNKLQSNLLSHS
jgi:hypothetical protein